MPTQTIISTQRVMQPRLGQKKPIKLCFIIRTDDDTEIRPGHSRTNGPTRFRMKPPGGGPDIKTATPAASIGTDKANAGGAGAVDGYGSSVTRDQPLLLNQPARPPGKLNERNSFRRR